MDASTGSARRAHVRVAGRVQGVFYRSSCAELARRLDVAGWVRNLPDGEVEAVFEGASGDVGTMLAWCREGPPHARVDRIEVEDEPFVGETGFRVLR
ncbi:MAG TPA: acylphosphatase [Actinomycetota bacterium]|jgi:acylphosphatase